jgi:hypothetical protein
VPRRGGLLAISLAATFRRSRVIAAGRGVSRRITMAVWPDKFEQVVVVLSTGRTGTQALAHYFNTAYDQVTALHEPKPTRHFRVMSNRAVAGKLTREAAVRALVHSRRRLVEKITRPIYIESNWYLYGFLEALKEVFGKPKILHVVRDPRTFIPSYINYGTFSGLKRMAAEFLPYWYLRPEQYEKNPPKTWKQMSEPERLAFHWHVVNREVDRGAEMYGGDYLLLRYEDIFPREKQGETASPAALPPGLVRLLDWVGLPASDRLLNQMGDKRNASRNRGFPKWDQWDEPTRRAVLETCGEQMERYGYRNA